MAINITVTKIRVDKFDEKLYTIALNLTCTDQVTSDEVINKNFEQHYETGESITDFYQRYLDKMQKEIDDYNEEQAIYNHAQMDDLVVALNNNLTE